MRALLVALVGLSLFPAVGLAGGNGSNGGGGTKPNSLIKVRNNGSDTLAVIINPSDALVTDLEAGGLTLSEFFRAGGRFVGRNGGSTVFAGLRAGTNTVAAVYIDTATSPDTVSSADSVDVTTVKGKTINVTATGSAETSASLSGPSSGP